MASDLRALADIARLNGSAAHAARPIVERRYTRDALVPLSADDPDFNCGWRCIPLPPSLDDAWTIFDTSKDYKTGWQRAVPAIKRGAP